MRNNKIKFLTFSDISRCELLNSKIVGEYLMLVFKDRSYEIKGDHKL